MAVASNTTYVTNGKAEDFEDIIFNVSPTDTPMLTMAKRKTATAVHHQWQTDALASPATNTQIEGDDAAFSAVPSTTLLSNYCQISTKTLFISRTADKVRKYGRAKEMAYQAVKKGKELKRDIEYALVTNQVSTAGAAASARQSAGFENMIAGNRILCGAGTTGTTPGYAAGVWGAVTDGTASASITEANLVSGIQAAWTDGGDPSVIMLPYAQKSRIAAFTGAAKYAGVYANGSGKAQAALVGAVDVYISDAGDHKLVLNRYMRSSVVFGIDPDYVSVAFLDGIQMVDLAKTGDSEKKMLVTEFCLVADNPDAHFKLQQLVA